MPAKIWPGAPEAWDQGLDLTMAAAVGAGVCALLFVYPYLIYPVILRWLPTRPLRLGPRGLRQPATLLFSARNEECALPETLIALRRAKELWPELRILAYDDASQDGTSGLLASASDILTVTRGRVRCGKARAMGRLLRHAHSDIVLFMDANVRVSPETLPNFCRYFADDSVGAVAATLQASHAGGVGTAYWRREERVKAAESATGSTMGCNGALWAIRRDLYPSFAAHVSDDYRPSMEALLRGYRVISAPDILATEPIGADTDAAAARKVRIARGTWHAHRDIRRRLRTLSLTDRFKYVSHKVLRWYSALWAFGAILFLGLAASSVGFGVPFALGLIALGAITAAGIGPFGRLRDISVALIATLWGMVTAMLGQRQAVWTPGRAA